MVMIIAEAGVNHNGNVHAAAHLIEKAKKAGADAIKFQAFTPEKLDPPGSRRDMLQELALSHYDFERLKDHADTFSIEFMATPFDVEWLHFLVELGMQRIKISSGDLTNEPLLDAAMACGLPVLLSTGMARLEEIEEVINRSIHAWDRITLMHCTSAYPCPADEANLKAIQTMAGAWRLPIGFSDHTEGIMIAISAVALGATVIEKHFTLDRNAEGPDHKASIEPWELMTLVAGARQVEAALGDGLKTRQESEADVISIVEARRQHRAHNHPR